MSLDAMVTTVCPTCGTELRSRDQFAGWPVRCSQCGTICRFPGTASPEAASSETAPITAEAVSEARCVICGKEIRPGQQWVQLADGLAGHSTCYEDVLPPDGQPAVRGATPSGILSGASGAFRYSEPSQPPQPSLPADELWSNVAAAAASEATGPLLPPVWSQRDGFYRQLIGLGIAAPVVSLLLIALLMTLPSAEAPNPPPGPAVIVRDAEPPPSSLAQTPENSAAPTAPEPASVALPMAKAEETPSGTAAQMREGVARRVGEPPRKRLPSALPGNRRGRSETLDRSNVTAMPLWACVLMIGLGLLSMGLGVTGIVRQRGPKKSAFLAGRGGLVAGILNVVLGLFLLGLAGRFTLLCLGLW